MEGKENTMFQREQCDKGHVSRLTPCRIQPQEAALWNVLWEVREVGCFERLRKHPPPKYSQFSLGKKFILELSSMNFLRLLLTIDSNRNPSPFGLKSKSGPSIHLPNNHEKSNLLNIFLSVLAQFDPSYCKITK